MMEDDGLSLSEDSSDDDEIVDEELTRTSDDVNDLIDGGGDAP